jgi:ribosome-binding ATPase YchF (GTP1/OBG family)
MEIGIVGLPNVGKSTLFNALLKKQVALAANYPFATIEPNIGVVPVVDERLKEIAKVANSQNIIYATVKFVDIAGLVKGASTGEGLGNKFLTHIREVDAIVQVVRDFSDENVIRSGSVDPDSDWEVIQTELALADMQTLENIKDNKKDKARSDLAARIHAELSKGQYVRDMVFTDDEQLVVKQMGLLTTKPVLKVLNVDEDKLNGAGLRISAKLESDLAGLSEDEQKEYMASLGITKSGLERLVQVAFDALGLQTFLTAGEKEARAWTIKKGTLAPQAAGVIHGDFEKHFIKADCINWQDFVTLGGWVKAREVGKVRQEGREYVMQDGDVVEFKVGV